MRFIYIHFYKQQKKKKIMAKIIDIRPELHQLIFLNELPTLNASSVAHILKNDCQMFPHNNK